MRVVYARRGRAQMGLIQYRRHAVAATLVFAKDIHRDQRFPYAGLMTVQTLGAAQAAGQQRSAQSVAVPVLPLLT